MHYFLKLSSWIKTSTFHIFLGGDAFRWRCSYTRWNYLACVDGGRATTQGCGDRKREPPSSQAKFLFLLSSKPFNGFLSFSQQINVFLTANVNRVKAALKSKSAQLCVLSLQLEKLDQIIILIEDLKGRAGCPNYNFNITLKISIQSPKGALDNVPSIAIFFDFGSFP